MKRQAGYVWPAQHLLQLELQQLPVQLQMCEHLLEDTRQLLIVADASTGSHMGCLAVRDPVGRLHAGRGQVDERVWEDCLHLVCCVDRQLVRVQQALDVQRSIRI